MDRFGRSLRFCYLKFDKEANSDDFMAHSRVSRAGGEGLILSDFRELSFCIPSGPCFLILLKSAASHNC